MLYPFSNRNLITRLESSRKKIISGASILPNNINTLLQQPLTSLNANSQDFVITVLDIETTGLNPEQDHIVSLGWVNIVNDVIKLSTAQHWIVKPHNSNDHPADIAQTLHHILPEQQKLGISLNEAINNLFDSLKTPVLLVHGACIEKRFLQQYFISKGWPEVPFIWLDSLKLEKNIQARRNIQSDFRLYSLRRKYHLPCYPAHHALIDAVATAELFLIQKHLLFQSEEISINVLHQLSQ